MELELLDKRFLPVGLFNDLPQGRLVFIIHFCQMPLLSSLHLNKELFYLNIVLIINVVVTRYIIIKEETGHLNPI